MVAKALDARVVRTRWMLHTLATPALAAAGLAIALMAYHRFGPRAGLDTRWILAKEGFLEQLTFVAELAGAALLALCARNTFLQRSQYGKLLGGVYILGAVALFIGGMEEIGWGQTLFHFETPDSWAAINYQQETTLHNLVDRDVLDQSARWIAFGFAVLALIASTSFVKRVHPMFASLAPHISLAPFALVIGFAGWKAHPEIIEVFIASYALIYGYQAWYRSRLPDQSEEQQDSLSQPSVVHDVSNVSGTTRILITGASGFIGSRLALHARRQGYEVVAAGLSRTPEEAARIQELRGQGVQVQACALDNTADVDALLVGCETVIHLAAAQHEVNVSDVHFVEVNVGITRKLLEACVRSGVKRFVYGSTIGVYGEAGDRALSESSPLNPVNSYGRSKAAAEELVRQFGARLPTVIVRISETYGPGDHRLLKLFNAVSKGGLVRLGRCENKHQPIHVRDLSRGLLLVTYHPAAVGETFVFAGPEVLTTSQMVHAIAASLGKRVPFWRAPLWPFVIAGGVLEAICKPIGVQPPLHRRRLDFFVKSFWFDTSKAAFALGFQPNISFEQGARDTLAWYRTQALIASQRTTEIATPASDVPLATDLGRAWQYSEILEFTHDAIIIWEMQGRGIVYWNRAAEQLYGYPRSVALGKVTHSLLRTKVSGGIEQVEAQLKRLGVWSGELNHAAMNDRGVLVQARLALIGQQDGKWLVLEVNRDLAVAPVQFEPASSPVQTPIDAC